MKNLLIYINPAKRFLGEYETLIKIQIDNSRSMGWDKQDIILLTNFDFKYNGVRAKVIGDDSFCDFDDRLSKINAIVAMFREGLVQDGELYWYHDFDAFQVAPITEDEVGLHGVDAAFTDMGFKKDWNTGSFFFTAKAGDIFSMMREIIYKDRVDEEKALAQMVKGGKIDGRYKRLDVSYNLGQYRVPTNYKLADKPIRVVHFHPIKKKRIPVLDIFLRGKSEIGFPLMPPRTIQIFNNHGII
jgi:hypothetical protein